MLGQPKFKLKDIDDFCSKIYNIIIDIIGDNGSLFVPTFSYSFSTKKNSKNIFDVLKTKSLTGPLSEYVRKKNSLRSYDPMVSISCVGKNKRILLDQGASSYGKNSTFENLLRIGNLKILNIGVGPNYIPFLHYVDYLTNCRHRYNKYFKGLIINGRFKKKTSWHYPVPYKRIEAISNGHKVAKEAKIFFSSEKLGLGNLYVSDYNKLFKFVLNLAYSDPWITANGPPFR